MWLLLLAREDADRSEDLRVTRDALVTYRRAGDEVRVRNVVQSCLPALLASLPDDDLPEPASLHGSSLDRPMMKAAFIDERVETRSANSNTDSQDGSTSRSMPAAPSPHGTPPPGHSTCSIACSMPIHHPLPDRPHQARRLRDRGRESRGVLHRWALPLALTVTAVERPRVGWTPTGRGRDGLAGEPSSCRSSAQTRRA